MYLVTLGNGSQTIYCGCKLPTKYKEESGRTDIAVTSQFEKVKMDYWVEKLTDKQYKELKDSLDVISCEDCF